MAYGIAIEGFVVMKKVIVVDAMWLKTKYRGNLLIASTQDNDHQCYSIAWAIVDLENDAL